MLWKAPGRLENDYMQGTNNYHATLQQAYSLLVHWKQDPHIIVRLIGGVNDGIAFMTVSAEGGHGRGNKIMCYHCGKLGHISQNCPEKEDADDDAGSMEDVGEEVTVTQLLMQGTEDLIMDKSFQLAQVDVQLPSTWVLLDNQSMVNIFSNKALLQDVWSTNRCMQVCCNAGWTVTNLIGRLPGYPGEVWYHPDGITNILSLGDMEKHFCITYDSQQEKAFIIQKPDGMEQCFIKTKEGLYYYLDTEVATTRHGRMLIITVVDKQSKYQVRKYHQAMLARKIQKMIGYPSTCNFIKYVEQKLIPNCPHQERNHSRKPFFVCSYPLFCAWAHNYVPLLHVFHAYKSRINMQHITPK
jgi:Zinc knuckle